jgi:hypothetical protein
LRYSWGLIGNYDNFSQTSFRESEGRKDFPLA